MRYMLAYVLLNVLSPALPHPKLRAAFLRLLGATIGADVRIEPVRFIQIQASIRNLRCGNGVFIGSGVTLDLSAPLVLDDRVMIGPNCSLITHQDFGSFNGSPLSKLYPKKYAGVHIGHDVAIGCDSTILAGTIIEPLAVIQAKSLVMGTVAGNAQYGSLQLIARHPRGMKRYEQA
jgi:acetyltransferase-like isoleucine patch superfamily enzyme